MCSWMACRQMLGQFVSGKRVSNCSIACLSSAGTDTVIFVLMIFPMCRHDFSVGNPYTNCLIKIAREARITPRETLGNTLFLLPTASRVNLCQKAERDQATA